MSKCFTCGKQLLVGIGKEELRDIEKRAETAEAEVERLREEYVKVDRIRDMAMEIIRNDPGMNQKWMNALNPQNKE